MSTAVAHSARTYPPLTSNPIPAESGSKRARSNGSPDLQATRKLDRITRLDSNPLRPIPPIIKKEPGSPLPSARARPKRLDLSSSNANTGPGMPSAPLTARDSAGLAIQDVGLACLSPGFQTNDPGMREQLQRSLDVRDRQRIIIESRQKGHKPSSSHDGADASSRGQDTMLFGVQTQTPSTARRKGPPPGLSISAPSAEQFAEDRVVQSAPMHQTFTGLRPGEHPFTRHTQLGPSGLSSTSHIHHLPATQTNNRLPPIADVFANDRLDASRGYHHSPSRASHSNLPPVPSPGFGPPAQHGPPTSARAREFRSAEEAVQGLSCGRDELLPKVVHYGGVQPPTPPSPMPPSALRHSQSTAGAPDHVSRPDMLHRTASMNGRRRGRDEYERDNGSPPSTFNRSEPKRTTAAGNTDTRDNDWIAGMSGPEKREEFLRLCERAWDLFHS